MRKMYFKLTAILIMMVVLAGPSCRKHEDVIINNNPNNGNNSSSWTPSPTLAAISGNDFFWNLSNCPIDPSDKEVFVVWIGVNGLTNYNKVSEGVPGVFYPGTIVNNLVMLPLNPACGHLRFNLAVNGGPPNNHWWWFTAQGPLTQFPCLHIADTGWQYDNGFNNWFSVIYTNGAWVPKDPC